MTNFRTPILLLIFNRPDTTQRVFNAIRGARPPRLFVAADGPRPDKDGEKKLCEITRQIIQQVDWECEVKTLFREENFGCGQAVSSAITWFFENVEEGIILEDDCLPIDSFFPFCQLMLEKYRDMPEVMMIVGTNFLFGKYDDYNSYYFSNLPLIWGWATWKRTWDKYPRINVWQNTTISSAIIKARYRRRRIAGWIKRMAEDAFSGRIDTWDAQLVYLLCQNNGLVITPFRNQISNIGYSGTHSLSSKSDPFIDMATKRLNLQNLVHPLLPPTTDWAVDDFTGKMLEKYSLGGFWGLVVSVIPEFIKKKLKKLLK